MFSENRGEIQNFESMTTKGKRSSEILADENQKNFLGQSQIRKIVHGV